MSNWLLPEVSSNENDRHSNENKKREKGRMRTHHLSLSRDRGLVDLAQSTKCHRSRQVVLCQLLGFGVDRRIAHRALHPRAVIMPAVIAKKGELITRKVLGVDAIGANAAANAMLVVRACA